MELLLRANSCSAVSGPHQPPDSSHRITQSELDLLNVGGETTDSGLGARSRSLCPFQPNFMRR